MTIRRNANNLLYCDVIKFERLKQGFKTQDIIDTSGIQRTRYYRIESGDAIPTIDELIKIERVLRTELYSRFKLSMNGVVDPETQNNKDHEALLLKKTMGRIVNQAQSLLDNNVYTSRCERWELSRLETEAELNNLAIERAKTSNKTEIECLAEIKAERYGI
jgi:transcriptional regulator with XRE-family HTH domain